MDFEGQKLCEKLCVWILVGSAAAAACAGFVANSLSLTMYTYLAGVGTTLLVCVPNWWFYNKHPLTWLDPAKVPTEEGSPTPSD